MKKLLLVVLIFLIIGTVSAHDDLNDTADSLLKDTEYNSNIDDDDGILVVEEDDYIPVEVKVNESWSLNVYIDRHDSPINEELDNVSYDQIDIPTSVKINDDEEQLSLGKHNIVYEFKFINTTSIYKPDAYISDSGVSFDFNFMRNSKNPQNLIYRFTSQFNIIKSIDPIVQTFYPDDLNITYSDSLSFNLKGIRSGEANFYIDDKLFNSYEIDENINDEELDTTKLAIGSYNLVLIVKSDKVYADYDVNADTSNSEITVNFAKSKRVNTPNRYIIIINTTLNVCKFPELNIINLNAPPIDVTYTRSIPVYLEGEGGGNLTVYIDGRKVYDNSVLLSWENACYIPTKDSNGNYFDEGTHDISFEFTPSDKYSRFNPEISLKNNALTLNFLNSQDSSAFLNDKYVANTKLNIINKNTQFIPIESSAVINIIHTEDINLKIDNLPYSYNLTVFVDDVEIFDEYTSNNIINIKTFFERSSIEETNERDIQTGSHSIRFEFKALYTYDVDVEFKDNTMHFKFRQIDSDSNPNGVYYQLNTSLIVNEKKKTVHILNVKNNTYFDDTEFVVRMDTYKPEDDDDWDDDDEENPIGTQDVGIIVSDENGIVYIGDNLMNVYQHKQWNYEFENEMLPKAGKYTIKIINLADNTYDTAKFEVKKANRIFAKKYTSDDFNVLFTLDFSSCKEDLNGYCHVTLNNEEKAINVKKGLVKSKKEVLFKDIDPGTYTATFTLKGNEIYNDVTLKSKVTVKKEAPKISYHKNGGNKLDLTIDIGKSKTDAVLIVSAGGVQKKFTVNKNTKHLTVEFDNLKSGSYDVEINFKGNERYTSKALETQLEITHHSKPSVPQSHKQTNKTTNGNGFGNNTGGIGTGSGDSNATGSGNGTYNGKISLNGKGFNGDLGSQGSGHGAKSYEVTKNIIKYDDNMNTMFILLIILIIILFLSFLYERRDDDDSEEY
ncbi:MAG: hypothetical protein IJ258_01475 [Methanobrevibacter sp.]|uniref:hypothetical protein n=1 Tax=Methanobrevibacter sp. TaxID=66852 RepID=UPI0025FDF273|nr:hypothetical protein [Methanobrevibacter sp.]MBQ8016753.1 hypothetical protein [Methanobrevibacter sp.]